MPDFHGQKGNDIALLPTTVLSDTISNEFGQGEFLITKPEGSFQKLILCADKGGWRVRLGDCSPTGSDDMPGAEFPGASNPYPFSEGGAYIAPGLQMVLGAPDMVTVAGYAADSVLTYWWL